MIYFPFTNFRILQTGWKKIYIHCYWLERKWNSIYGKNEIWLIEEEVAAEKRIGR